MKGGGSWGDSLLKNLLDDVIEDVVVGLAELGELGVVLGGPLDGGVESDDVAYGCGVEEVYLQIHLNI